MTPYRIVDYVVIHKLYHLIHFCHSKEYWQQVRLMMPDYEDKRDRLKTNAGLLNC